MINRDSAQFTWSTSKLYFSFVLSVQKYGKCFFAGGCLATLATFCVALVEVYFHWFFHICAVPTLALRKSVEFLIILIFDI